MCFIWFQRYNFFVKVNNVSWSFYYTPKFIKNEKLSLFVASLWPTIVNALIIGWELYKFFGLPFALSAFQVGFGEFVVITIVGLPVFKMVNNKYGNRIKIFNSK